VALVRERTIPTERPPPVGEVSAKTCKIIASFGGQVSSRISSPKLINGYEFNLVFRLYCIPNVGGGISFLAHRSVGSLNTFYTELISKCVHVAHITVST
jgi:hypothetical protein